MPVKKQGNSEENQSLKSEQKKKMENQSQEARKIIRFPFVRENVVSCPMIKANEIVIKKTEKSVCRFVITINLAPARK